MDQGRHQQNLTILTRLHKADGLGFSQLKCCDPLLALHLRAGLEVEGLCATVRDDESTGVLCVNECIGKVDGATACV